MRIKLGLILPLLGLISSVQADEYTMQMNIISVCSWSGDIAQQVQYIRQTEHDSVEQYQINATQLLQHEQIAPELVNKIISIGKDVYENVPEDISLTQVFVMYYQQCLNDIRNEDVEGLHF